MSMFKHFCTLLGITIFTSIIAFANSSSYNSYCLEAMSKVESIEKPFQVVDPVGIGQFKWILTWDGNSIFRESDIRAMGKQIGTSKQEIWGLKKFKDTGDGASGAAPALQLRNAYRNIINNLMFKIANLPVTAQNAKLLDETLAACEGVSSGTTVNGEPTGEAAPNNVGDAARALRDNIRTKFPNLFKSPPISPHRPAVR